MKTLKYKIEFHDFWCVTSGLAGGAKADILTLKDANNLPYIPGRTLKGLLREAAELLQESGLVDAAWTKTFFGEREWREVDDEKDKHRPRVSGSAFFRNATLSRQTATTISNDEKEMLFETLASTAIDNKTGIAQTHSLRRTEAVVPCTVYAEISIDAPTERDRDQLESCMKFIKRLGHHRTRGLGRCTFSIISEA